MDLEGLFRFSIDNALELIISFDENGVITYANPTAEQQLEFEEGLCGHLIKEIFPGEFQSEDEKSVFLQETGRALRVMSAYRKN